MPGEFRPIGLDRRYAARAATRENGGGLPRATAAPDADSLRSSLAPRSTRGEPVAEVVEGRVAVAVEDEAGGEADDPGGAEVEELAAAGGQLPRGDQRGDSPALGRAVVPDLAAPDVL